MYFRFTRSTTDAGIRKLTYGWRVFLLRRFVLKLGKTRHPGSSLKIRRIVSGDELHNTAISDTVKALSSTTSLRRYAPGLPSRR